MSASSSNLRAPLLPDFPIMIAGRQETDFE
jgi:hypothetical protein